MMTYLLAALILAIVMTVMAVGVLCGRKPIKGSCGGMRALQMDTACDICGGDTAKCEKEQERLSTSAGAVYYEAGKQSGEQ